MHLHKIHSNELQKQQINVVNYKELIIMILLMSLSHGITKMQFNLCV
jgi:hypothetical protein